VINFFLDTKESVPTAQTTDEDSDDEVEFVTVPETDAERREALLASEETAGLEEKLRFGNSWKQFQDEFNFTGNNVAGGSKQTTDVLDISSDEDDGGGCDVPVASGSTFTTQVHETSAKGKGKLKAAWTPTSNGLGLGKMVQTEIDLRKKESLGMAPVKGGGRTLGPTKSIPKIPPRNDIRDKSLREPHTGNHWSCLICTL
jgi:hypothetical protein